MSNNILSESPSKTNPLFMAFTNFPRRFRLRREAVHETPRETFVNATRMSPGLHYSDEQEHMPSSILGEAKEDMVILGETTEDMEEAMKSGTFFIIVAVCMLVLLFDILFVRPKINSIISKKMNEKKKKKKELHPNKKASSPSNKNNNTAVVKEDETNVADLSFETQSSLIDTTASSSSLSSTTDDNEQFVQNITMMLMF